MAPLHEIETGFVPQDGSNTDALGFRRNEDKRLGECVEEEELDERAANVTGFGNGSWTVGNIILHNHGSMG